MRLLLPTSLLLLSACWVSGQQVRDKVADLPGTGTTSGTPAGSPTGSGTGTGTGTGSGTGTGTGTGTQDFSCVDMDIGSAVGNAAAAGDTSGAGDDHLAECVPGVSSTGADTVHQWVAPSGGCFAFDTSSADFDTVVYVLEGDCAGPEVACNDDFNLTVATSEVGLTVAAGTTYLIVVDGHDAGDNGSYQVDILPTSPVPWDIDLGSGTGLTFGDNIGADSTLNPPSCFYNSGSDVVYRWVVPTGGTWNFALQLLWTDFDSALSLHRPCTADAMACADVVGNGGESITAVLFPGEEVMIRVSGYEGATGTAEGYFGLMISN